MYHKNKALGLILGGGGLVETLIKECNKRDVKNYIIAVDDNFKLEKIKPDIKINFDNLGNIFSHLKNKKISQVVLLGSINKKPLFKIKPNPKDPEKLLIYFKLSFSRSVYSEKNSSFFGTM